MKSESIQLLSHNVHSKHFTTLNVKECPFGRMRRLKSSSRTKIFTLVAFLNFNRILSNCTISFSENRHFPLKQRKSMTFKVLICIWLMKGTMISLNRIVTASSGNMRMRNSCMLGKYLAIFTASFSLIKVLNLKHNRFIFGWVNLTAYCFKEADIFWANHKMQTTYMLYSDD